LIRAFLIWLLLAAPAIAQTPPEGDAPLTRAEVTEIATMLDGLVTGSARYAEAEKLAWQALALVHDDFGEESREALEIERIIVMVAVLQGRSDEGVQLGLLSAQKAQRLLPADDPLAYRVMAAFAAAMRVAGHQAEALALASEAVTEADRWLPPDELAGDELRLVQALLAASLGNAALAESAFARLEERLSGRKDKQAKALLAMGMAGWADFVSDQGDAPRAVPLFQAAIAALDAQFAGIKHPRMVPIRLTAVRNLAEALILSGHRDEVEPLIRPLLAEVEAVYGTDSPLWAELAFPLAVALGGTEPGAATAGEAAVLLGRTVDNWAAVYSADTEDLLRARMSLAVLQASLGRLPEALDQIAAMEGKALPEARPQLAYVLYTATEEGRLTTEEAVDAMLHLLQDSQSAGAAAAQRLLAERLAAGTGAAAAALRAESDTRGQLRSVQAQLAQVAGLPLDQRDPAAVTALRDAVKSARAAHEAARARIAQDFPDLAAATGGLPLSLAQIRARLGRDEALVVIDAPADADDFGLIIAVSPEAVDWHTFQADGGQVTAAVSAVRDGIDLRLGLRGAAALEDGAAPQDGTAGFDYDAAHWLYTQTLGQVAGVIATKRHLWLDLRGPLSALPPALMLASPATGPDPGKADWLVRHHSVAILPAISALSPAGGLPAGEDMLAFADPDLGTLAPETTLALRGGLAPLPETAAEVRDVATALGAGDGALRLGDAATEAAVKAAPLDQVGLLYFATHGLVSGDAVGAAALEEPALALTPGQGEDGFLTASEIAELHLNARFVVLSACNTAAGDAPGAEALSGLAQSFLYAGARSLLVSHWPVESRSAVALMTDLFRRRAADPALPAAEAQRQAMLDLIDHPADPRWSHPAYWAPFVLVGQPD